MDNKKIQFQISFDQNWILSKRGDDVLPPKMVIQKISEVFKVKNESVKVTYCSGVLEIAGNMSPEEVVSEIRQIILKVYDINPDSELYTVEISDYAEPEKAPKEDVPKEKPTDLKQKSCCETETSKTEGKDISAILDKLVGAGEFKQLVEEVVRVAPALIENDIVDSFTSRAYLVSINEGYGLSTYLNCFADVIEANGLFELKSKTRVAEVALAPYNSEKLDDAFRAARVFFSGGNVGKVVCIDISEWMSKLHDKHFRDFLKLIDDHAGSNIVFFRIPYVEQSVAAGVQQTINDLLFVKSLSIPPFNSEELKQCAESILKNKGYSMDEEAWKVFEARLAIEKSDGRFYGINTINKVIREMLYAKLISNLEHQSNDKTIYRTDLLSIVEDDKLSFLSGTEQLRQLVGMDAVREKVEEIIAQIETALNNKTMESPCVHMRFVGNPGTGKTTIARIIGTILKEKGILRNGSFFEYTGRDLCGRYVGETAPKTSAICRDAYGSVLFIDEAYSLFRNDGISSVDYGREAIDTLVAEMENHRTDLVVIMAGYPDEMKQLMNGNAGLKSRMPYLIEFPNYTRKQLADIFFVMARKNFRFDESFETEVIDYFDSLSDKMIRAKEFSNARFVRNLFERTWGKAALRCQLGGTQCDSLTVEDFKLATADKEFQNTEEAEKRPVGFI